MVAKKKRKRSGLGAGAIAGIVLGALLLLGGVGIGILAVSKKKSGNSDSIAAGDSNQGTNPDPKNPGINLSNVFEKKTPPPKGWVAYVSKYDNFRAYFPVEPKVEIEDLRGASRPRSMWESASAYKAHVELDMGRGQIWAPLVVEIDIYEYKSEAMWNQQRQVSDLLNPYPGSPAPSGEVRRVTLLGMPAQELRSRQVPTVNPWMVSRCLFVGLKQYNVQIGYLNGLDINPKSFLEDENAFFDNFELLR
jgi:hypothetical protein